MMAPLAPHIAEELWARLGHDELAGLRATFPVADPALLRRRHRDVPGAGQRQGARPDRGAADISDDDAARSWRWPAQGRCAALDGRTVRKVIVRAPQLVNIVAGVSAVPGSLRS